MDDDMMLHQFRLTLVSVHTTMYMCGIRSISGGLYIYMLLMVCTLSVQCVHVSLVNCYTILLLDSSVTITIIMSRNLQYNICSITNSIAEAQSQKIQ